MKYFLIIVIFILLALITTNIRANELINSNKVTSKQVSFIQNKGQWDTSELGNGNLELEEEEILFLAELPGLNIWVCNECLRFEYYEFEEVEKKDKKMEGLHNIDSCLRRNDVENYRNDMEGFGNDKDLSFKKKSHVIQMDFVGCNENLQSSGLKKMETYYNYFIGNNNNKWASHVPLFEEVVIENLYDGIDLKLYFDDIKPDGIEKHQISYGKHLRYDFIINPGADPSQIKFSFDGQNGLDINDNGEINLSTNLGDVRHGDIFAYQNSEMSGIEGTSEQKQEVTCIFEQDGNTISFNTGEYDTTKELVIDPLIYSTFIGAIGSAGNIKMILTDNEEMIIACSPSVPNFPTTTGVYDNTFNQGYTDQAVTKFKSDLYTLDFSTFIGGDNFDAAYDFEIDSEENIYLVGKSTSTDFPTTEGAISNTLRGSLDATILKLKHDGTELLYSTFYGGDTTDYANNVLLDEDNIIYVLGITEGDGLPVVNAYDDSYNGLVDPFFLKLDIKNKKLLFATYFGTDEDEAFFILKRNNNNEIFIGGATDSHNFFVSENAYQKSVAEGLYYDSVILKFANDGSDILLSTYLGGNSADMIKDFSFDKNNNLYITGKTHSTNFPTSEGVYRNKIFNSYADGFVCKMNPDLSLLLSSTYIGGRDTDSGELLLVDNQNNVLVTGNTKSTNFPITENAYKTKKGGDEEIVLFQFDSELSKLNYSTYYGGSFKDIATYLDIDNNSNILLGGATQSYDFPVTANAFDNTYNAYNNYLDVFISKFAIEELFSSITESISDKNIFSIYPNPSSDFITINPIENIGSDMASITISNIFGEIILELHNQDLSSPTKIDVRNLPVGTYYISVKSNENSWMEKLVKI